MRTIRVFLLLIAVGGGILAWRNSDINQRGLFLEVEKPAVEAALRKVEKGISAPSPITAKVDVPESLLTRYGILAWTNIAREENGDFAPLNIQHALNRIAELRLEDMFSKQYFEHVSPAGEGASQLAEKEKYEYLALGENIARGNFPNDKEVVKAWMESPGHRANILNEKYGEIGIAAREGVFEGKMTWLAVQIFGMPVSACPSPDEELRIKIEDFKTKITLLESSSNSLRSQIKLVDAKSEADVAFYNQLVAQYNSLIEDINRFVNQVKGLIAEYNAQVEKLNECINR